MAAVETNVDRSAGPGPATADRQGQGPPRPGGGTGPPRPTRRRSLTASWRQTALRRFHQLRIDLLRAKPAADDPRLAEYSEVEALLQEAGDVAEAQHVIPTTWWSGAEVERTWRLLREVEERLVDFVDAAELDARAADAVSHARHQGISDGDPSVMDLAAIRAVAAERRIAGTALSDTEVVAYRAAVRAVLGLAHARSDRDNQEARAYRNRLLLGSVISLLAAVALVALQALLPRVSFVDAPTGWRSSPAILLVAIMLFGCAGALFTAIPVLAKQPSDFSPFNLPLQQAILKMTFGALTALFGVAAFGAVSVNGLEVEMAEMTVPALIVLAVAFGAAQQAVTRFFDGRASQLLNPTGTSDSTG
jgi:hypothetical protein